MIQHSMLGCCRHLDRQQYSIRWQGISHFNASSQWPACGLAGRRQLVVLAAKKGGKGGGQKKGPGSLMDIKKEHPYEQTEVIMQNLLMLESFYRKVGRNMMEDKDIEIKDAPKALWDAPFALLSHEFGDSEAKYDYANKAALDLFETQWDQLVGKPSTITSPEDQQVRGDREQLLQQAREKGTVEVKDAIRRTLKGGKIHLISGVLWTIEAPTGEVLGQAVQVNEWELEDGTRGGPLAAGAAPSADAVPAVSPAAAADPEAVTAAEAAVEKQGQLVRGLKETHGKANSDPEVKEAVSELLKLKQKLEQLT